MKKRILTLVLTVIVMMSFAACGASDTPETESKNKTDKTHIAESGTTEKEKTDESKTDTAELKDGTFRAESDEKDKDGYKEYAEVTIKDGKISKIDCNAENDEGKLKKDDESMSAWVDKIAIFENEVINKGIENISLDTNGKIADLDGMDLDVSNYAKLITKALEKAKKG